jgi:ribonucleotide reductase alpha subunit
MKRVRDNQDWSLFCPNEAKGLYEVYGEEFERLYIKYESQGIARKTIKA